MKKKHFKLSLFSTSFEMVNSLIIGAAAHNGGMAETTLEALKTTGEGMFQQFKKRKYTSVDIMLTLVDNKLLIDGKEKEDWIPIAEIEEVEIFEMVANQEKEEVL